MESTSWGTSSISVNCSWAVTTKARDKRVTIGKWRYIIAVDSKIVAYFCVVAAKEDNKIKLQLNFLVTTKMEVPGTYL